MRGILRTSLATMLLVALVACGGEEPTTPSDVAAKGGDVTADPADEDESATSRDARVARGEGPGAKTGREGPEARHRRGDPSCARIETRTRNVASASGGPMQMIMVTECVPAGK